MNWAMTGWIAVAISFIYMTRWDRLECLALFAMGIFSLAIGDIIKAIKETNR